MEEQISGHANFGQVLGGFGESLGKFGQDLERFWADFGKVLGRFWKGYRKVLLRFEQILGRFLAGFHIRNCSQNLLQRECNFKFAAIFYHHRKFSSLSL